MYLSSNRSFTLWSHINQSPGQLWVVLKRLYSRSPQTTLCSWNCSAICTTFYHFLFIFWSIHQYSFRFDNTETHARTLSPQWRRSVSHLMATVKLCSLEFDEICMYCCSGLWANSHTWGRFWHRHSFVGQFVFKHRWEVFHCVRLHSKMTMVALALLEFIEKQEYRTAVWMCDIWSVLSMVIIEIFAQVGWVAKKKSLWANVVGSEMITLFSVVVNHDSLCFWLKQW